MNIKEYYKEILNSEINEKLIGKQHKIDADGNKKINTKDFAIINAKKKSAMNRVTNEMYGTLGGQAVKKMQTNASVQGRPLSPNEKAAAVRHAQNASAAAAKTRQQAAAKNRTTGLEEMALTKDAFNTMLKGVKKARDMGDATSGNKSALHWRNYEKQSDALVNALKSPKLFDMGPKGGLVQIGRLKGSRDATGIITSAANFRTKVPKTVLRSAKELAKLHGMFYVTHGLGDEDVTNPIGKTTAVGGKLGPTSGFIRQSRRVSDGFDQQT